MAFGGWAVTLVRLELIKQAIIAPRSRLAKTCILLSALAFGTALRLAIDAGANGVPFLTFYPVILLAAIFLGGGYAALAAVLAVLCVRLALPDAPWIAATLPARLVMFALYSLTILIIIVTGDVMRRLVLENEAYIRQQDTFNSELQHRTKNALQIMRALIARGPRGEDPARYFQTLAGRLDSLAKANELLRFGALESAGIGPLVDAAIAPFGRDHFVVSGPDCQVSRPAATPLMMALHELCTNAHKYGALSADGGTVTIAWQVARSGASLEIEWTERGGPPVDLPTHRGLGWRLLAPNGGLRRVDLDWQREGLVCRMVADAV